MKGTSALHSAAYRRFITAKNQVLEEFLLNSQRRQTDTMRSVLSQLTGSLSSMLLSTMSLDPLSVQLYVQSILGRALRPLVGEILLTRKRAYILSMIGQAEAIGQAEGKETKYVIDRPRLDRLLNAPAQSGGDIGARVALILDRLARKIVDAYQMGKTLEEKPDEIMNRILECYPKSKIMKGPPKGRLRRPKLEEADAPKKELKDFTLGFISDADWEDVLDEYATEYIPKERDPKYVIAPDELTRKDKETVYAWEYEQELTEDFVSSVRAGEVDAARENGIEEFVHIAIIDNKTDECCKWRDGLTLTEIKKELGGAKHDQQCYGLIPPLHFNCRCRIEPVLGSISDRKPENAKEFDEWLES